MKTMPTVDMASMPNRGKIISIKPEGVTEAKEPGSIIIKARLPKPPEWDLARESFSRKPIRAKIRPNSRYAMLGFSQ